MTDIYGRPYGYNTPYNNYQVQNQPSQMRTNKIFVTSLEDALNRYADPNTVILYRHQDEKYEYEITTDGFGKKTYKTFEIKPYSATQGDKQAVAANISPDEISSLKERLSSLERRVFSKYKDEKKSEGLKDE